VGEPLVTSWELLLFVSYQERSSGLIISVGILAQYYLLRSKLTISVFGVGGTGVWTWALCLLGKTSMSWVTSPTPVSGFLTQTCALTLVSLGELFQCHHWPWQRLHRTEGWILDAGLPLGDACSDNIRRFFWGLYVGLSVGMFKEVKDLLLWGGRQVHFLPHYILELAGRRYPKGVSQSLAWRT
jgi:hypothetical protein